MTSIAYERKKTVMLLPDDVHGIFAAKPLKKSGHKITPIGKIRLE